MLSALWDHAFVRLQKEQSISKVLEVTLVTGVADKSVLSLNPELIILPI